MTHYNYKLQVWVKGGIVAPCGHPRSMGAECCNAGPGRYAGLTEQEAIARHQDRTLERDQARARLLYARSV